MISWLLINFKTISRDLHRMNEASHDAIGGRLFMMF